MNIARFFRKLKLPNNRRGCRFQAGLHHHKPKIGPYQERIAQIIEEDKGYRKKQRRTAKRIYNRIKEMGYQGGYTQVKVAVREIKRIKWEVFMALIHRASSCTVSTGSHPASLSVSFVTVFSVGGVSAIPEASVRNHESVRNTVGQTAHRLLVPRWMGCHRP